MKTDEKELIESVLEQQPGAFEALLERYRSLIYSVFYGKGFDLPDDSVDDLFNSFVLALKHRDFHRLRAFSGRAHDRQTHWHRIGPWQRHRSSQRR